MPTIKEIAEMAGVSRGTVDRVLNNRGSVNAQTAQRVAALDIPCFACAPEKLPELLEQALTGRL